MIDSRGYPEIGQERKERDDVADVKVAAATLLHFIIYV